MNKLIQEQLSKVQIADLSNFDEIKNTFTIKKKTDLKLVEDQCYLIELNIENIKANKVLLTNWNNNTYPAVRYLKIDVSKSMGKMIKVNSVGYDYENSLDLDYSWSGWLPIADIKVLESI